MDCPYCDVSGDRGQVHAHLAEQHGDLVIVTVDEERNRRTYAITCPTCGAPWERQIKPRARIDGFVETFSEEIKLVAFDMLLYHIQGEHMELPTAPESGEESG